MEYCFIVVKTPEEISRLAMLASEIWHEFFPCILTDAQLDYMVEKFQSETAITRQLQEGYQYTILLVNQEPAGYFGICQKPDGSMFLSKFYLKQAYRGKGFATIQFQEVQRLAAEFGASSIWLTVNKHNTQAIAVYEHFGMRQIRSEITDIGSGFVMDDYVYALEQIPYAGTSGGTSR